MSQSLRTPKPAAAAAAAELPANLRATRLYLGAACFLAGASMMIIEICAYRLLAPLFGNSVYTWTALIGVVLVAFSAGGYLGGRLADRRAGLEVIGWLLAGSAILTFLIPVLNNVIGPMFTNSGFIVGSVLISLLLFALPGALLGAVSPASVRFYSLTLLDTHVGVAAGTISMLGSLGSFVGTFLSGFVLLAHFGVRSIFIGTALLLLLLSVTAFLLARKRSSLHVAALVVALGSLLLASFGHDEVEEDVIYQHESFYHRISVTETGTAPHRQRILKLDRTNEGGMNPDTGALIFPYQSYWRLIQLNDRLQVNNALFIGAGAFGMPEEMSREYPQANIDVAEIDPHVIEVGKRFFRLDQFPKVKAYGQDARRFLVTRKDERWDMIFGDAYNGERAIPSHLVTREFFQLVADRMTPEGVFIMNTITAVQGEQAELLGSILATLRSVFPHVEAFAIDAVRSQPQNVILLASRQDWLPYIKDRFYPTGSMSNRLVRTHVPSTMLPQKGQVLTDDFNPVDAIIARGLLPD